jgi:hypothetical protein
MRAGNWAGLGVLFLLPSCIFPPLLLGALVCFIGMAIAIQQGKQQTMAGVATAAGLVQTTTNAHWSSFEKMTSEYGGVFRVVPPDGQANKLSDTLRVGETLRVAPVRTQNDRGVTIDTFNVISNAGVVVGRIPPQIDTEYVEAMKVHGAAFDGRVHHIATGSGDPVILVEFRRCDAPYLAKLARERFLSQYGVYLAFAAFAVVSLAVLAISLYFDGEFDHIFAR